MTEDQDIIFVDFDDLFDPNIFEEQMNVKILDDQLISIDHEFDEKNDHDDIIQ